MHPHLFFCQDSEDADSDDNSFIDDRANHSDGINSEDERLEDEFYD